MAGPTRARLSHDAGPSDVGPAPTPGPVRTPGPRQAEDPTIAAGPRPDRLPGWALLRPWTLRLAWIGRWPQARMAAGPTTMAVSVTRPGSYYGPQPYYGGEPYHAPRPDHGPGPTAAGLTTPMAITPALTPSGVARPASPRARHRLRRDHRIGCARAPRSAQPWAGHGVIAGAASTPPPYYSGLSGFARARRFQQAAPSLRRGLSPRGVLG